MAQKFVQIPAKIQQSLATNAGIVLKEFNPNAVGEATQIQQNILFATTGGVNPTCVAELQDDGEDIDNCPKNAKEMQRVISWECKLAGTALTVTTDSALSLFGIADKSGSEVIKIDPRKQIKPTDFKALWYVCPYGTDGGFVAIKLDNALSTGGFSMQSADNGKGQFAFEYTGYSSIEAPEKIPFEFYLKEKDSLPASEVIL